VAGYLMEGAARAVRAISDMVTPGAKGRVNIPLREDLLREAETLISDLSGTLEELPTFDPRSGRFGRGRPIRGRRRPVPLTLVLLSGT